MKVIIFSSSPSANYEDVKQLCLHIYLQSNSPLFSFLFMLCGFILSLLNFEFYYALCPCIDTIFFFRTGRAFLSLSMNIVIIILIKKNYYSFTREKAFSTPLKEIYTINNMKYDTKLTFFPFFQYTIASTIVKYAGLFSEIELKRGLQGRYPGFKVKRT